MDVEVARLPLTGGDHKLLLGSEQVPFANSKIGPGAPPVKTKRGWLTTLHAVWKHEDKELPSWHGKWNKEYRCGIMLLDLDDPARVIGLCETPLLVPRGMVRVRGAQGRRDLPGRDGPGGLRRGEKYTTEPPTPTSASPPRTPTSFASYASKRGAERCDAETWLRHREVKGQHSFSCSSCFHASGNEV